MLNPAPGYQPQPMAVTITDTLVAAIKPAKPCVRNCPGCPCRAGLAAR